MRSALALLLLLWAAPVPAAPVRVSSGEHPGFTRLVLNYSAGPAWRVGRIEGGYEFRAGGGDVRFDASDVFRLVPRTRLAAISAPADGVLRLATDCLCHIVAFSLAGGQVVLDLVDGPPDRGSVFERRLDIAQTREMPAPPAQPAEPAERVADAESPDPVAAVGSEGTPRADLPLELPAAPPPGSGISTDGLDLNAAASRRVRAFEAMILEQLARAGAQGLILPAELVPPAPGAHPDTPRSQPAPAPAGAAAAARDEVADHHSAAPESAAAEYGDAASDDAHAHVETVIDRDRPEPFRRAGIGADGRACPPNAVTDLAGWGFLVDGAADIARFRENLVDEMDRTDDERGLALARYYIYLTFGAEAMQQLAQLRQAPPDRATLAAIAEIMDRTAPGPGPAAFLGRQSCGSSAAMWAMLSGDRPDHATSVDSAAVVRGYSELPEHVKRHLGPRLIDALRAAGAQEAAEIVRNRMNLAGPGGDAGVAVANAALERDRGNHATAEAVLHEAIDQAHSDSPEALLALAENRIAEGGTIDDGLLASLEALAYELKGQALGMRLDQAIAEAYLGRGAYRTARDLALAAARGRQDVAARQLLRRVYLAAAASAGGTEFLRMVLPTAAGLGESPEDAAVRRAVAVRLLDLGFPAEAVAALGGEAGAPEGAAVAARAQLALGRPAAALDALSALPAGEAAGLSALAQEMRGDWRTARRLYDAAGAQGDAARMALMARDWPGVADLADGALGGLARALSTADPPVEAAGGQARALAAASALVEASRRDREAVEKLLGAY